MYTANVLIIYALRICSVRSASSTNALNTVSSCEPAVCTPASAGVYKGADCKIDILAWGAMSQPRSTIPVPNVVLCVIFKHCSRLLLCHFLIVSALSGIYLCELT